MSGLVNTYLQKIRAQFPNNLDRDEWRFTRYGLLESAKTQSSSANSILTPDIKSKAEDTEGNILDIPVMKKGSVSVSNTRTCTIGGFENETDMVNVTWRTLVADVSMMKSQYHKNEVNYLYDFNKKMELVQNAFAKEMENSIFTAINGGKSKVYNSTLVAPSGAKYDLVGDSIRVKPQDQELFFNDIDVIMQQDDIYDANFEVLGSTPLMSQVRHYLNQGAGNDEKLDYQYGPYAMKFTNHIPNGTGVKSSGFIMPDGSVGLLTRINIDSRMGNNASDGTSWEQAYFDVLGMNVGVMHKSKCSDLSGVTGLEHLTASMVENFQFSIDFAVVTPYNSDDSAIAGTIKKFEFLT